MSETTAMKKAVSGHVLAVFLEFWLSFEMSWSFEGREVCRQQPMRNCIMRGNLIYIHSFWDDLLGLSTAHKGFWEFEKGFERLVKVP